MKWRDKGKRNYWNVVNKEQSQLLSRIPVTLTSLWHMSNPNEKTPDHPQPEADRMFLLGIRLLCVMVRQYLHEVEEGTDGANAGELQKWDITPDDIPVISRFLALIAREEDLKQQDDDWARIIAIIEASPRLPSRSKDLEVSPEDAARVLSFWTWVTGERSPFCERARALFRMFLTRLRHDGKKVIRKNASLSPKTPAKKEDKHGEGSK